MIKGTKKEKFKKSFECKNYDRKFLWRLLKCSGSKRAKTSIATSKPQPPSTTTAEIVPIKVFPSCFMLLK